MKRLAPVALLFSVSCASSASSTLDVPKSSSEPELIESTDPRAELPAPYATPSVVNYPIVTGWPQGVMPKAPAGFVVSEIARSLDYPRQVLVLDNGDLLVAEAKSILKNDDQPPEKLRGKAMTRTQGTSANRITLLRDEDRDGRYERRTILRGDLNQPFGMAFVDGHLYVAVTDALLRFPYTLGAERIDGAPEELMKLPAGGYNNHWTRNLRLSRDAKTLFVSVGSASNVGEHGMAEEEGRAAIHAFDLASQKSRVYASGLRNPVGMDVDERGVLWTSVNERDELGDQLVPDYIVGVRDGAFYGWPYSYFGDNVDPRRKGEAPEMVAKAVVPDMAIGSHTAALGFVFADRQAFGEPFGSGAFIARHGSWNRSQLAGYDVVYVRFEDGKPVGEPEPFVTGFVKDRAEQIVNGRPVSLQRDRDGSLIVVDDAGGRIWRVRAAR